MKKFEPIRTEDNLWTFKNTKTGKNCKSKFIRIVGEDIPELIVVQLPNYLYGLYNPATDFVFTTEFAPGPVSIEECVQNYPEEFEQLPTSVFREKYVVMKCLDAIADEIKKSNMDPKKVVKIYDMISSKIEKEKKNIEIANQKEAENAEKNAADRAKRVEIAKNIRNLGEKL